MSTIPANLSIEDETQHFYAALGKAIMQWQGVEAQLAIIYANTITSEALQIAVANAAFHAVLNFSSKIDMVEAAFQARDFMATRHYGSERSEVYMQWNTLKNRALKRSKRRNDMAHFAMHFDAKARAGSRIYLAPNSINVAALLKHQGRPPRRNACMLSAQGNSFQQLAMDLQDFYARWALQLQVQP